MSSERNALIDEFLSGAGLAGAGREPLPGDASTRRYVRLRASDGRCLMLMDAPPLAEGAPCPSDASDDARRAAGYNSLARLAAGRVDAFAACAAYLRGRGLSAPEVLALDIVNGLAVVEDLGDRLFARLIEQGADERELYFTAIDALVLLHQQPPPQVLLVGDARWPLLTYDALALKTGADLFVEWLPRLDARFVFDHAAVLEWDRLWAPIRHRGEVGATAFAHRDYHAENLIWLPEREGIARVGMIDFQDAVRAHPAWDLLSLLQDARRDVSPELEAEALDRYLTQRPRTERSVFMADYAGLAALNEARILGIFARLVGRDGKPRYRQFMPRMWRHLERNLKAPGMEGLKAWFDRHVPADLRI